MKKKSRGDDGEWVGICIHRDQYLRNVVHTLHGAKHRHGRELFFLFSPRNIRLSFNLLINERFLLIS